MNAHAETCGSGDNTLEATKLAVRELTQEEGDEYFCILLSDANLDQYGIAPSDLKALLDMDERVNVFIVFIGSMGNQAQRLRADLPNDRVFVTLNTSEIPAVLKRIFLSSVLKE
jgi:von Willebrand factor A domain-containing protein 8